MSNGGGGISGFINTFFEVENVKRQREQLALMQQNSLAQRTALAANLASLIANPNARQALSFVVGGDEELSAEISSLLETVAPGAGVLERYSAMLGLQQMEEGETENLQEIAATQEVTGMPPSGVRAEGLLQQLLEADPDNPELTELSRLIRYRLAGTTPGAAARDTAVAGMSQSDLEAMERIAGGLDLSEFERNQIAKWAADNGLSWRALEQQGALGLGQLLLRKRELDLMAERAQAQGSDMPSPNTLITSMVQSLAAVRDRRMSKDAKQQYITLFNASADNLTAMGLYPPNVRLPTDPDALNEGFMTRVEQIFVPFDNMLRRLIGLSIPEIDQSIHELLEANQEEISRLLQEILTERQGAQNE